MKKFKRFEHTRELNGKPTQASGQAGAHSSRSMLMKQPVDKTKNESNEFKMVEGEWGQR